MKRLIFQTVCAVLLLSGKCSSVSASDNLGWQANFRRIALDISPTEVSNAQYYQDSPNTQLSTDSETVFKGVFDFVLEYGTPNSQWNNSLLMEYGKTRLRPVDGQNTSNENTDKILLTSDYSRKLWRYRDMDLGPFASLGYQTEFTANDDAPRNKVFRAKSGLKLFNGKYLRELYFAAVGEADLTYAETNYKSAYEIGIRAEYPLRDGVKFQLESYFRDYLSYSRYIGTDFRYEFNLTSRMEVKIKDEFGLAPFISYFQAQSRQVDKSGSNFMIGLSLSYSQIFNL